LEQATASNLPATIGIRQVISGSGLDQS